MSVRSGTYELGPEHATLSVRTERAGAAAKAGHDLLIHVKDWKGTVEVGEDGAVAGARLEADATSFDVIEGTGGAMKLGDEDMANIRQTIDDEVLKRERISFRSATAVPGEAGRTRLEGELSIVGRAEPFSFELELAGDGSLAASAVVTQSGWGIKPYSALFGALKVKDEVAIAIEGRLPDEAQSR